MLRSASDTRRGVESARITLAWSERPRSAERPYWAMFHVMSAPTLDRPVDAGRREPGRARRVPERRDTDVLRVEEPAVGVAAHRVERLVVGDAVARRSDARHERRVGGIGQRGDDALDAFRAGTLGDEPSKLGNAQAPAIRFEDVARPKAIDRDQDDRRRSASLGSPANRPRGHHDRESYREEPQPYGSNYRRH